MTLQAYTPQRLDELALRMLDLAAVFRELAQRAREHEISGLTLHDKKALDWCAKFEAWARKCQAEMTLKMHASRAAHRAAAYLAAPLGEAGKSP